MDGKNLTIKLYKMKKELKKKAENILDNRLFKIQIEKLKEQKVYQQIIMSMTEMVESDTFPMDEEPN